MFRLGICIDENGGFLKFRFGAIKYFKVLKLPGFQSGHFFIFCVSWSKNIISTKINKGLPIPLMCYLFIILFFRILALEILVKY